jgi:hypothetical protein
MRRCISPRHAPMQSRKCPNIDHFHRFHGGFEVSRVPDHIGIRIIRNHQANVLLAQLFRVVKKICD